MILDGTKNKEALKVMRPYQVYATQKVIDGLKRIDFEFGDNKVGYIWHTTGSGKTITSFKTAWLASRMPKIDKVVFLVDRIALTNQTTDNYRAYDPDAQMAATGSFDEDPSGSVRDTKSTADLSRKLKSKDNGIIVTSVQKLDKLVKRPSFSAPDKNIVFIVDEAHRSTGATRSKLFRKHSNMQHGLAIRERPLSTMPGRVFAQKISSGSCCMPTPFERLSPIRMFLGLRSISKRQSTRRK